MSAVVPRLHDHARAIFAASVDAVDPYRLIRQTLTLRYDHDRGIHTLAITAPSASTTSSSPLNFTFAFSDTSPPPRPESQSSSSRRYNKLLVVAVGKCALPMAAAADEILSGHIADGGAVCLTKHGHIPEPPPQMRHFTVVSGGHPIPDSAGEDAAKHIAALLDANRSPSTLILLLLSGGGSALMTCPPPQSAIRLEDIQSASRTLQSCGADITELNTIRKHISGISGGRFAARAQPATVVTLILSDVVGSSLTVIGSGPTVPDTSTFADCSRIIQRYNIAKRLPPTVMEHIRRGLADTRMETPKTLPANKVHNILVGSNLLALSAALKHSQLLGYNSIILTDQMSGNVGGVSRIIAEIALTCRSTRRHPVPLPAAILIGGEPTVVVNGDAKALGGRSQHGAALTAQHIAGHDDIVVLAGGTDGGDGPTDAAGAIVDGNLMRIAKHHNIDTDEYIRRCDSYHFFQRIDQRERTHDDKDQAKLKYHLITGPTNTNVMDLWIALIGDNNTGKVAKL